MMTFGADDDVDVNNVSLAVADDDGEGRAHTLSDQSQGREGAGRTRSAETATGHKSNPDQGGFWINIG